MDGTLFLSCLVQRRAPSQRSPSARWEGPEIFSSYGGKCQKTVQGKAKTMSVTGRLDDVDSPDLWVDREDSEDSGKRMDVSRTRSLKRTSLHAHTQRPEAGSSQLCAASVFSPAVQQPRRLARPRLSAPS